VTSSTTVDHTAARPGVDAPSVVSSLRLTADSQPQYAKTPRSSPEVSATPPAPNGLSQDNDGSMASRELPPVIAL
jgi:hypothetical protein